MFNDGLWEVQVTACYSDWQEVNADTDARREPTASNPIRYGVCAGKGMAEAGAAETYLHGVPMMPMNLERLDDSGGGRAHVDDIRTADDADHGHNGV